MAVPAIPSVEDLLLDALKFLGFSGVIIGLVKSAFAVQSWRDNARQIMRGARVVHGVSRTAVGSLAEMRPIRIMAATFVTVAIPFAQLLTLAFCYFAGNLISMFVHEDYRRSELAQREIQALWRTPTQAINIPSFLELDRIAAAYLLLAAIFLIRSYVRGTRWDYRPLADGIMVALPGFLILLFVGGLFALALIALAFFAVWALLTGGDINDLPVENFQVLPLGVGTALAAAYWGACHMAVSGSRLLIKAWSRQTGNE